VQIVDDLLLQTIVQPNPQRPAEIPQHISGTEPEKHPHQELSLAVLNYIVDNYFDQPGRDQLERRRQPCEQEGADHHYTVRAEVLEHSKQSFHERRIFTES